MITMEQLKTYATDAVIHLGGAVHTFVNRVEDACDIATLRQLADEAEDEIKATAHEFVNWVEGRHVDETPAQEPPVDQTQV